MSFVAEPTATHEEFLQAIEEQPQEHHQDEETQELCQEGQEELENGAEALQFSDPLLNFISNYNDNHPFMVELKSKVLRAARFGEVFVLDKEQTEAVRCLRFGQPHPALGEKLVKLREERFKDFNNALPLEQKKAKKQQQNGSKKPAASHSPSASRNSSGGGEGRGRGRIAASQKTRDRQQPSNRAKNTKKGSVVSQSPSNSGLGSRFDTKSAAPVITKTGSQKAVFVRKF